MGEQLIDRFLKKQAFLVLDGSMAGELEKAGADLNDPLWSARVLMNEPHLISKVHYDYLAAGADIICTSSYQASFTGFALRGLMQEQAIHLFELSVKLTLDARTAFWADPQNRKGRQLPLIAASLGPYGAHLADGSEYRGDYELTLEQLMDWHRPQVAVLADHEAVDLILFETIPSLLEAEAIVRLLQEFPFKTVAVSFSARDGRHLSAGTLFRDAVDRLSDFPQVAAIGVNCTAPGYISQLLDEARSVTDLPLMVYPNSGEYWNAEQHCWYGAGDLDAFSHSVSEWYQKGARIIGGCCRTSPEHTREIRKTLERLSMDIH
ncbi:MAG: homocysteine S-methyltransferase [Lewinella sp.]|nr:homocysteine S-methyltransferase [Lewinella sp.]